jgi:DNA-binding transcriptional regulator GbsR (MarR family)
LISYPEGAPGTVWIDDIQIEEGDKATEYSDFWNIEIIKMIKKMKNSVENINATQQVLKETLPDSYKQNETYKKLDKLLSKLEQAGGKLKNYDKLSKTEMAALVRNVDNTSSEVTKLIENL